MKYGFVKVCAATPEIKVANVEFNSNNIINAIKESAKMGSEVTVFPELCLCGYTCGDLFNQKVLLDSVEIALAQICEATSGIDTLVFVGAPIANCGKLYNCAVAISGGKILGIVPKTHIPNYGEFYERRYFSPAPEEPFYIDICGQQDILVDSHIIFSAANCPDFTVSAEICEDLWSPLSPSIEHTQAGSNIIVNLSASDELAGKAGFRKSLVKMQSAKLICGYIYADAGDGESTTDMAFSGHNLICENGVCVAESKLFENGFLYGEIDVEFISFERRRMASSYYSDNTQVYSHYAVVEFQTANSQADILREISKTPFIPQGGELNERAELILTIQSKGLEKRLKHTGVKTAVIGISGGLDSALALLVTCRAFKAIGKSLKDIIAITMPAFGTTDKTKNNSLKLIEAVGATCRIISVGESVLKHFEDIGHDPDDRNVTYENAQARMRTLVLMDIANDTNGLVIGTGDLSELALGWATYNGDHMSMYGVNASVPKTLVKHLINYEAEKIGGAAEKVLKDILNTEISPELLPPEKDGSIAQKTEDLVGPYILHDFFLYYAIRCTFAPDKIYYLANKAFKGEFDAQTLKKWLKNFYKRFFAQQFKRSCVPDGVKVGSVCLSPRADWRMPSDATAKLWLDLIEKL
ncbi:MAG: NAD(+) synthase [Clostridiales bacterium]|nr:NAD(+) synthase [Clostridiales bacterium]